MSVTHQRMTGTLMGTLITAVLAHSLIHTHARAHSLSLSRSLAPSGHAARRLVQLTTTSECPIESAQADIV
jgi:hypothetical protein